MTNISSAVQSLHRQTESAASFCKHCREFGHSHHDCIYWALSRIEKIECALIDGPSPSKGDVIGTLIILLIGGVVGGAMGALFTLVIRGVVR